MRIHFHFPPAQMSGREEGRRDSENEQEKGRTSQQLVLPTPGGVNQDAPASSLELDLHRVRGPGESGSAERIIQITRTAFYG